MMRLIVHTVLPVLLGVCCYKMKAIHWFDQHASSGPGYFFSYHLADGLWAYSFCSLLLLMEAGRELRLQWQQFLLACVVVTAFEASPLLGFRGTYDAADVTVQLEAATLSFLLLILKNRNHETIHFNR